MKKKIFICIGIILLLAGIVAAFKFINKPKEEKRYINEQVVYDTGMKIEEVSMDNVDSECFVKITDSGKCFKLTTTPDIDSVKLFECKQSENKISYELGKEKAIISLKDKTFYIQYDAPKTTAAELVFEVMKGDKALYFLIKNDTQGGIELQKYEFNPGDATLDDMYELYSDKEYKIDINNDGTKESVEYKQNYSMISNITVPSLKINGFDCSDLIKDLNGAIDTFYVVNLGHYSNYVEFLFVNKTDDGYKCRILSGNGENEQIVTSDINGMPGKDVFMNNGQIIEKNTISKINAVYNKIYQYEDHKFSEVGNSYEFIEPVEYTIDHDIVLLDAPGGSETETVYSGSILKIDFVSGEYVHVQTGDISGFVLIASL